MLPHPSDTCGDLGKKLAIDKNKVFQIWVVIELFIRKINFCSMGIYQLLPIRVLEV